MFRKITATTIIFLVISFSCFAQGTFQGIVTNFQKSEDGKIVDVWVDYKSIISGETLGNENYHWDANSGPAFNMTKLDNKITTKLTNIQNYESGTTPIVTSYTFDKNGYRGTILTAVFQYGRANYTMSVRKISPDTLVTIQSFSFTVFDYSGNNVQKQVKDLTKFYGDIDKDEANDIIGKTYQLP